MKSAFNRRIGIVSDSENVKSLISSRLQAQGLDSVFIRNGHDVIVNLQQESPVDALFIDLDDPGVNHSVLLPKLHEEYPLLKVVAMASDCDPHRVRMAMHNGVFDFMPKPLDIKDFDLTIQRTVRAAKELQKKVTDYEDLLGLEYELDLARNIQSSIIPKAGAFSPQSSYEITGKNQAAQKVGGDFYDYFQLDGNRLGFVIGDVASKGIPAAVFMAVSRTLFKTIALKGVDPATCLSKLNRILVMESDPSMFIAMFYGILDVASGEIVYSNGGHTYPMIVRTDGSIKVLDHEAGIVLGVVGDVNYQLYQEKLQAGDLFFTGTDGFSELTDDHGKPVSDHFLKRNLIKHREQTPEQILNVIYESINQIHPDSQSVSDDITCLLLKFNGSK